MLALDVMWGVWGYVGESSLNSEDQIKMCD